MVYELTTVLTTIAAASASFVAILGGFIASKLIAISGERAAAIRKLNDIDEEIAHRTRVLESAQKENDEEDALHFIFDHIEWLDNWYTIDTVYKSDEHPYIKLETLRPYWDKARDVCKQYRTAVKEKDRLNADYVPQKLAVSLRNDDFGYKVCKKIGAYYRKLERDAQRKNDPYYISTAIMDFELATMPGAWHAKNEELIAEQHHAIEWLNLQREQQQRTKDGLQKPKGIVSGLVVFALFSVLCIVCPLVCSPFITACYNYYLTVKIVFLVTFIIGLSGIFAYLIWLLKWDEGKKWKKRNDAKEE